MYEFAVSIAKPCKGTKKKLRYTKKINKIPDFSRVVLVYCTSYQPKPVCCYAERMDKPET